MREFKEKLIQFIKTNNVNAEHIIFEESCHSVEEAAKAANVLPEDLVKNICLINGEGNLIVAIVKGEDRVSTTKVGKVLNMDPPRIAKPEEILEKTGYICGGVPSFGYEAIYLIDSRVMEKDVVYTGGGTQNSLVRITTQELQRVNSGQIVNIRKK